MSKQCAKLESASTQYFSITSANQTSLDPSGSFDIEMKIKPSGLPASSGSGVRYLTQRYAALNQNNFFLWITQSEVAFGFRDSSSGLDQLYINSGISIANDEWTKLRGEFDTTANTLEFFIDDVSVGSTSATKTPSNGGSQTFYIGRENGATSTIFNGKIADYKFYNNGTLVADLLSDGDLLDNTANGNDLTNNNSATFVNDNPGTDISNYGSTEGTDYVSLTINSSQVDATLTDFPVYLDLSQVDSGDNFWSTVSSDGSDIRVTDSTGSTQYACEVVNIDTTGKTGEVHFKIDSLSGSTDTDIRVYYDGSSAARDVDALYGRNEVWSDYEGVWHNEEDPSGSAPQMIDSTGRHDGTSSGSMTSGDSISGVLGNGLDFDGSNDQISFGTNSRFAPGSTDFTVSAWFNSDSISSRQAVMFYGDTANDWMFAQIDGSKLKLQVDDGSTLTTRSSTTSLSSSTDYYAVWQRDYGSNFLFYLDGSSDGSGSDASANCDSTSDGLSSGYTQGEISGTYFDGLIDELRYRKSLTSSSWVSTEYNNQKTPSSFWTYNAPSVVTPTFTPKVIFI